MKEACISARRSISLEQYIFENDQIGRDFADIFIKKNREGVRIRILCDMVGSLSFYNSKIPALLRSHGIEVRFFNPIQLWRVYTFSSWFFRNHRKILIVDDNISFTGGIGLRLNMRSWRDTYAKFTGEGITNEIKRAFEEMWEFSKARSFGDRTKKSGVFAKGFQFLTNSPHLGKRFFYHEFIESIRNAQTYCYITTPYFVPDRRLVRVLSMAALRGVDVVVLIPEYSNHPLADRASHIFFDRLLRSGVHIYRYQGNMLHAKTAVIDNKWSTIGSFNLDSLSFTWNYEANVVSTTEAFCEDLRKFFEKDLEQADELALVEWRDRSFLDKMKEKLITPIRRFL